MNEKTKRAWAGLMKYANGLATEASELRRILADCMDWVDAVEPFGLLDPIMGGDEKLLRQAVEYRPSVHGLLLWVCSTKSKERDELGQQAQCFLREHTEHIGGMRLKEVFYNKADVESLFPPTEWDRLKEEHNKIWADWKDSPLGILAPSKEYQDIADPICDFVLSEYQKYRNREYSRRDKKRGPPFPIFICPSCKKLVMPERTGRKKYCDECSDRARASKYRQKASPDENKDYQWLYRLRKLGSDVRKDRLRNLKVRERLKEVKARQRNSSRCQNLIQDMRL